MRFLPKLRLPRAIKVFLAGCILLFLTSIYAHKIEPNWLEVKQIKIAIPHLDRAFSGYRIVQLTDLHVGDGIDRAQLTKIVATVNAQQPDLIVLTGDFVSRNPEHQAKLLTSTLAGFQAHDGTLAVLGNHDVFDDNGPSVRRSIVRAGAANLIMEFQLLLIGRSSSKP